MLIPLASSAFAGVVVSDLEGPAAQVIHQTVADCVAAHPWWGTLTIDLRPAGDDGRTADPWVSVDESLLDSDSEHFYASPDDCLKEKLAPALATREVKDWMGDNGGGSATVTVERDEAARSRIHLEGVPDEIGQRLLDRAQRCGGGAMDFVGWFDVEVLVGRYGFDTPTGVVHAPGQSAFEQCLSKSYLMDLKTDVTPKIHTLVLTSSAAPPAAPPPAPIVPPAAPIGKAAKPKKGDPPPPPPPPVPAPPPPPAAAEGTLDGAPVHFVSALAWTEGGGTAIVVELSTTPATCDAPAHDGTVAQLVVAPMLRWDGSTPWRVTGTSDGTHFHTGDAGPVAVTGDVKSGVHLALPATVPYADEAPVLVLTGSVQATGCGDRPDTQGPPKVEVPGLSFTIAGHPIVFHGAIVDTQFDRDRLFLSSDGLGCDSHSWGEDFHYELELPNKKGEGQLFLSGRTTPAQTSDSYDKADGLLLKVGKPVGGKVQVTVNGKYDHSQFPVEIGGTFTALDCR